MRVVFFCQLGIEDGLSYVHTHARYICLFLEARPGTQTLWYTFCLGDTRPAMVVTTAEEFVNHHQPHIVCRDAISRSGQSPHSDFFDFGPTDSELIITQLSPFASGLTDDIDKNNPSFVL